MGSDKRKLREICRIAARVFFEKGYDGASMQDIAGAVGLTKAGLYHHVGSKDRLLFEITGVDEKTIRRGREELAASLVEQPTDRIRQPGGGRPPVEKKRRSSFRR